MSACGHSARAGLTELHPLVADMDPRLQRLSEQDLDLAGIDIAVNTAGSLTPRVTIRSDTRGS